MDSYYTTENYYSRSSIGYLIRHASKLLSSQVSDLFEGQEINFLQYIILMQIKDDLAKTAAEICQNVCHDSGALTRIIDQLVKNGLLQRERDLNDARYFKLKLTEKGRQITDKVKPRVFQYYNELLTHFHRQEVDQFIQFLQKLNTIMQR